MDSKSSKKWLGAAAAVALCSAGCASTPDPSGGNGSDQTGSSRSAEVAPLACTPLLSSAPLFTCGATTADNLAQVSTIQSQVISQMQAAMANLSIQANWSVNQVVINSQAAQFGTFFGGAITAPLIQAGLFTTTVPLTLTSIAPGLTLQANIFGTVPMVLPTIAATPLLTTSQVVPLLNTTTNAQFAAFNSATLSSANTAAVNTAAISASTMPLTILITTPITTATLPAFTCSGTLPFACN